MVKVLDFPSPRQAAKDLLSLYDFELFTVSLGGMV